MRHNKDFSKKFKLTLPELKLDGVETDIDTSLLYINNFRRGKNVQNNNLRLENIFWSIEYIIKNPEVRISEVRLQRYLCVDFYEATILKNILILSDVIDADGFCLFSNKELKKINAYFEEY